MSNEEVDFEAAKPLKLAAEISPEKITEFFKGEIQTPLHPKEITEEMLSKLYENLADLEQLSKLVEMQKKDIKELGSGLENVQRGAYIAMFKPVKGRKSFNWKKFIKVVVGDITEADMEKYSDEGEPSVRLEIRKLDSK